MRTQTSLLFFTSLLAPALGNFHIGRIIDCGGKWDAIACPSNEYNCDCFANGKSAALTPGNPGSDSYFQVKAGLCGMGALSFYKDGNNYKFYVANGNGNQIGTCYPNSAATVGCSTTFGAENYVDGYVCYSSVCN
ncbi:dyp-type peroxidase [Purpureocillium lavendulum]|uniref:Dyp-type peroxidase n=1 Tax=Purpureocillium lavendulum TaxID=1247861 RepID=A0AB34FN15_9HYPO|nr:dyp-type peroxidase [Purpureocillium lavendulum]